MDALILIGGEGRRLGKLGKYYSKSQLWLPGGTIFEHQLRLLRDLAIQKVVIIGSNPNQEISYYLDRTSLHPSEIIFEKQTGHCMASSILRCEKHFRKGFIVLHGDNIFTHNLRDVLMLSASCEMSVFVAPKSHMPGYPIFKRHQDNLLGYSQANFESDDVVIIGCYWLSLSVFSTLKKLVRRDLSHSIINIMHALLLENKAIMGVNYQGVHFNINTPSDLLKASTYVLTNSSHLISTEDIDSPNKQIDSENSFIGSNWIDKNVVIENSSIGPNVAIGQNTYLRNCQIENSIIFPHVNLTDARLSKNIVTPKIQVNLSEASV